MSIKTIVACVSLMFAMANLSQAKEWRGIVPLQSTRADVERLLGLPTEPGIGSIYDTKNERVLVFYSAGSCIKGEEWNVPRDTVLRITVHPNAKLLVADLRLDMNKYKREPDYHSQNIVYYFNRDEGVFISARILEEGGEFVDNITYGPAATDNHLRCPDSKVHHTCNKTSSKP